MASDPRRLLQRVAATPRGDLPMTAVFRRAASLRRRRRATVAVCVAALSVAGSLSLARGWGERAIPPINPIDSPSPSAGIRRFPSQSGIGQVAFGDGSLWIADWTLYRLDESSGEVEAETRLPGAANALVFEDGLLWALVEANDGRRDSHYISVIDPETNELFATSPRLYRTNIGSTNEGVLAVGNGSAWVAFRGEMLEVDSKGKLTRRDLHGPFRINDRSEGAYTTVFGDGSLWVMKGSGPVWRFDIGLQSSIGQSLGPNVVAADAGSEGLWISHYGKRGHALARLSYADPADLEWLDLRLGLDGTYWEPIVGGDSLWLVRPYALGPYGGGNVIELDERTGRVVQRLHLHVEQPYGATATDDELWINNGADESQIIRVPSKL